VDIFYCKKSSTEKAEKGCMGPDKQFEDIWFGKKKEK
jgi:hypothetical protein